jgi:Tol biopolymer transport system component
MEFIDGETLEERITNGPLKLEEAVRIAMEIASALQLAHDNDIVHRDIKSANVMLAKGGAVKVLDFGLAQTAASTKLTRLGSTLGTVAYMSPEQARGEQVDHRTDIWAVGAVLYEMVAGRQAFPGDYEQAVVYAILNTDPEPLTSLRSGIPLSLDWIVNKLVAKDRKARYQSMAEVLVDLAAIDISATGMSRTTVSGPISPQAVKATAHPAQKRTNWVALVGTLVVGLLIGLGIMRALGTTSDSQEVLEFDKVLHGITRSAFPVLSPTGQYLAVAGLNVETGESGLFLYDMRTGTRFRIPESDGARGVSAFSKDEKSIAFNAPTEIKVADLPRGAAVPVDEANGQWNYKTWDEDGNLYYTGGLNELRVLRPDNRIETILTPDSTTFIYAPQYKIPGENALITIGAQLDPVRSSIVILDLDTLEKYPLDIEDVYAISYIEPGYLFVQEDQPGKVLAYPFSLESMTVTGRPVQVLDPQIDASWSITEQGHLVRFAEGKTFGLEMVAIESSGGSNSLPVPLLPEEYGFDDFEVSPDGSKLAAQISAHKNGEHQIFLFDLASGTPTQFTYRGTHTDPSWSPDGSSLAFAEDYGLAADIFTVPLSSPAEKRRVSNSRAWARGTDWSPVGDFVVFHTLDRGRGSDIWKAPIDSETSEPLITDAGSQEYPQMSPDGRYMAYQSDESGSWEVSVYDFDTKSTYDVTSNGGRRPRWVDSGQALLYWRDGNLYKVSIRMSNGFATGPESLIYEDGFEFFYDQLPDGRIAVARVADRSESTLHITWNWPGRMLVESANR